MCFRSEIKRLNMVFLPPRIYAFKNFFLQNCLLLSQPSSVLNLLSPGSFLPARRMGSRVERMWALEASGSGPGAWPHPPSCVSSRKSLHLSESWFLICKKVLDPGSQHTSCVTLSK